MENKELILTETERRHLLRIINLHINRNEESVNGKIRLYGIKNKLNN